MKILLSILLISIVIQSKGQNVGIGTPNPQVRLDIAGTNSWDLVNGEGDVRIGNSSYRMKFGVALAGGGAGSSSIMQDGAPGGYNALSLGSQGNYLMFLYGNNKVVQMAPDAGSNVGIGPSNPSEKLEVTGNIKADNFKYKLPITRYYSIPDGAFSSRAAADKVAKTVSNGGAFVENGGPYGLVAPVYLPHNAKVTAITIDFYDGSATQDLSFILFRQFSSGLVSTATASTSGNIGLNIQTIIPSTDLVIDNSLHGYQVIVFPTSGNWISYDLAIRRVTFTYTMDEVN
ncbi:MAG: hypothetical protein V4722_09405 [Bacteroidota bacterium]